MTAPSARKPWPLWWVVAAIVIFVTGYTFVTLKFRKTTKPAEPVHDAREKYVAQRLEAAGYKRIEASAERPAEPAKARSAIDGTLASVKEAIGGLTPELKEVLVEAPVLPDAFTDVKARGVATAMLPYPIVYTCNLPDLKGVLGETRVYIKGDQVAIVTNFERLSGSLLARTKESTVQLSLPPGTFASGLTYDVTLVGRNGSKRWTVQGN